MRLQFACGRGALTLTHRDARHSPHHWRRRHRRALSCCCTLSEINGHISAHLFINSVLYRSAFHPEHIIIHYFGQCLFVGEKK